MFRRLFSGTLHYGIGQSLPQVIRFLLIPVFTLYLSPSDYGTLELAGAIGTILVVLMRFGVAGAVSRFYFDYSEGPALRDYVTTVAIFMLASSVAVAILAIAIGPWLFHALWPELPFFPIALIVIAGALIGCNQNLQDRLVQAREQASYAAKLNIGRAAVSLTLALLFVVVFSMGVVGMLVAELIAGGLIFVQALRYLKPELSGKFNFGMLKASLIYSAGILPNHCIGSISILFTKSFLSNADSLAAVGLLGIATRFTQPLNILANAFQNAYNPVYFSLRNEKSQKKLFSLAITTRNVWAGAVWCALSGAVLGPALIQLLTPARFHEAARLVPILTLGFLAVVLNSLFGPEIFYSKRTYLATVTAVVSAITTILVTIATVGQIGAAGLAWALVAGQLAATFVAAVFASRTVSIPHPWFDLMRATVVGAAIAAVGLWFSSNGTIEGVAAGAISVASFPMVLWLVGDPSVREIVGYLEPRLKERCGLR